MKINADLDNICIGTDYDNSDLYIYSSENLYSSKDEEGSINTSTGENQASSSMGRTIDFIATGANRTYTLALASACGVVIYFYNNGTWMSIIRSSEATSHTFTTPANCTHVRFRYANNAVINQSKMLVRGSVTPNVLKGYVDPQLIVTNEYGGHRTVFDSADFLKFHRYKQKIGTWYDGSPVYMITGEATITNDNGQSIWADTNDDVKEFITVFGRVGYGASASQVHILGGYFNENYYSGLQLRTSNNHLTLMFYGKGYAAYNGRCVFNIVFVGNK